MPGCLRGWQNRSTCAEASLPTMSDELPMVSCMLMIPYRAGRVRKVARVGAHASRRLHSCWRALTHTQVCEPREI